MRYQRAVCGRCGHPITHKRCTGCWENLPAEEFASDPGKADGLASWCRDCKADARVARHHGALPVTRRSRGRAGVFVCLCQPALAGGECGTCRRCGHRIAGLMHPAPFGLLAAKYPAILDQGIEWPDRLAATG